ncbi:hypothetical protein ACXYMO_06220 [Arenibacterium sp. CAU 1754]
MPRLLSVLFTGLLVLQFVASNAAHATSIVRQLSRTGLTQDDINTMSQAAATLYASGNAVSGADTIWSNPETGAFGMVEVTSVEGDCVGLVYKFQTLKQRGIRSVVLKRCLVDNRWVLTE